MVYLRKKYQNERRMCYEYGKNENEFIGTIEFDVGISKNVDISKRNVDLKYYNDYAFCRLTTSALQGIAKFIRDNSFPENYLRATH